MVYGWWHEFEIVYSLFLLDLWKDIKECKSGVLSDYEYYNRGILSKIFQISFNDGVLVYYFHRFGT